MTTTKFDEREITLTRFLDAPRALVFQAWTDPKHLAQWWGPKGFTNPVCDVDLRVGGVLNIVMHAPYGMDHPMTGVFQEIVEPERLVFTNIALDDDGSHIIDGLTTVTFEDLDGKTKLTVQTRGTAMVEKANQYLKGMDAGWTQSLDKLQEYVSEQ